MERLEGLTDARLDIRLVACGNRSIAAVALQGLLPSERRQMEISGSVMQIGDLSAARNRLTPLDKARPGAAHWMGDDTLSAEPPLSGDAGA